MSEKVDVEQVGPLLMALAQFGTKEAGEQLEKMFRALAAERDEAMAAMPSDGADACFDNAVLRAENAALRRVAEAAMTIYTLTVLRPAQNMQTAYADRLGAALRDAGYGEAK